MKAAIATLSLVVLAPLLAAQTSHALPDRSIKKPFDASPAKNSSTQIQYHGGPVMTAANSVYIIYYGTFAASTEKIVDDFVWGLGDNSPEYGVNHSYNQPPGSTYVQLSYTFKVPDLFPTEGVSQNAFFDPGSEGTQLNGGAISSIVANALNNGLPQDVNGIYLVITAPDIKVSGFCSSYCAYHTAANVTLNDGVVFHARYALIPDPSQRCDSCNGGIAVYGDSVTPNGDIGADTMTDDIVHELSETVTDPDISAWYTQNGAENGDLCNFYYGPPTPMGSAWTLGTVGTGTNSAGAIFHYNAKLPTPENKSSRLYLIQQIWANTSPGACSAGS